MIRHLARLAEVVENVAEAVDFYWNVLGLSAKYGTDSEYAEVEQP